MSAMENPRNCCGMLSSAVHMCFVGWIVFCFRFPAFLKCAGNSFLYLLSGIVFTSVPGSTLTGIGLLPCLVIIWSVIWNDECPS